MSAHGRDLSPLIGEADCSSPRDDQSSWETIASSMIVLFAFSRSLLTSLCFYDD